MGLVRRLQFAPSGYPIRISRPRLRSYLGRHLRPGETFTSLDGTGPGALGDLPINSLVRDHKTGDLYAATDFTVLRRDAKSGHWHTAAKGLPMVEVSSLAIDSGNSVLYAATHGRSAWRLDLK